MINNAVAAAEAAFETYSELPPATVAEFIDRVATEIVVLGDALIVTSAAETALSTDRLNIERTALSTNYAFLLKWYERANGRMSASILRSLTVSLCDVLICAVH